jgi:phage shock protein E
MSRIWSVAVVAALLCTAAAGAAPPPVATAAAEAVLARETAGDPSLVILDVRTAEEFAAGHVPGAVNVPHDQLEARLGELASLRDRDVVVYCKSGRRAGLALAVLAAHGYTRLSHLDGDMQGWEAAGRPVAQTPAASGPAPRP